MFKPKFMSFLLVFVLVISLAACGEQTPTESSQSSSETPDVIEPTSVTEPEVDEPAEVPAVITAEKYEKSAVDVFGYGGIDFLHTVEVPKIDSENAGAEALNEKIYEKYGNIVQTLKSGEEGRYLYRISYSSSSCDGLLFICVSSYVGVQYSEGSSSAEFYYYDAQNDCEISADDYLAHFGLSEETLCESSLWCNEYPKIDANFVYSDKNGELSETPLINELGAAKVVPEIDCKFLACEVTNDTVRVYFEYTAYVQSTFSCALNRETLQPVYPIYACYIQPTGTTTGKSALEITFEDGKVTQALVNDAAGDASFFISSFALIYTCEIGTSEDTVLHNSEVYLNESPLSSGSSAGLLEKDGKKYGVHAQYISDYIPSEELTAVVISTVETAN